MWRCDAERSCCCCCGFVAGEGVAVDGSPPGGAGDACVHGLGTGRWNGAVRGGDDEDYDDGGELALGEQLRDLERTRCSFCSTGCNRTQPTMVVVVGTYSEGIAPLCSRLWLVCSFCRLLPRLEGVVTMTP